MYEWNRHLEVKSEMALPRLTIVQAVREFSVFVFFSNILAGCGGHVVYSFHFSTTVVASPFLSSFQC